jgi:hypothetical protein
MDGSDEPDISTKLRLSVERRLKRLGTQLKDLAAEVDNFGTATRDQRRDQFYAGRVDRLVSAWETLLADISKLTEEEWPANVEQSAQELEELKAECKKEITDAQAKRADADNARDAYLKAFGGMKKQISDLEIKVKELEDEKNNSQTACQSRMDEARADERRKYDEEKARLQQENEKLQDKYNLQQANIDTAIRRGREELEQKFKTDFDEALKKLQNVDLGQTVAAAVRDGGLTTKADVESIFNTKSPASSSAVSEVLQAVKNLKNASATDITNSISTQFPTLGSGATKQDVVDALTDKAPASTQVVAEIKRIVDGIAGDVSKLHNLSSSDMNTALNPLTTKVESIQSGISSLHNVSAKDITDAVAKLYPNLSAVATKQEIEDAIKNLLLRRLGIATDGQTLVESIIEKSGTLFQDVVKKDDIKSLATKPQLANLLMLLGISDEPTLPERVITEVAKLLGITDKTTLLQRMITEVAKLLSDMVKDDLNDLATSGNLQDVRDELQRFIVEGVNARGQSTNQASLNAISNRLATTLTRTDVTSDSAVARRRSTLAQGAATKALNTHFTNLLSDPRGEFAQQLDSLVQGAATSALNTHFTNLLSDPQGRFAQQLNSLMQQSVLTALDEALIRIERLIQWSPGVAQLELMHQISRASRNMRK